MKNRRKRCLNPVNQTSGAHCPLVQQFANCDKPCPGTQSLNFMRTSLHSVYNYERWMIKIGFSNNGPKMALEFSDSEVDFRGEKYKTRMSYRRKPLKKTNKTSSS